VSGVLGSFSAEEIAESTRDGAISVTCEFCGKKYGFDPAAFAQPVGATN
jgi:molecular chaperone Hsp33